MVRAKKNQVMWKKFQRMSSPQVFLCFYLLHKPDYAYNIAKTLKKLNKRGLIRLYKLKTLTRPNVVSSVLSGMKKDGLVYVTKKGKVRGRHFKVYEINTEVFSNLLHSHFPDANVWHDCVINNLIERFRILIPADDKKIPHPWQVEIDKIGIYNYITFLCYIYDQIIKDLGFAYLWQQKALKEHDASKRKEYLELRNHWIKEIKTNMDQEFKKEKINQTFDKLIDVKKIKAVKKTGKASEYIPLEFQRELIKEQIYKNLEKIISNIRESFLEVIALSKEDRNNYIYS